MVSYSTPVDQVCYTRPRWTAPASFLDLSSFVQYINSCPLLFAFISIMAATHVLSGAADAQSVNNIADCSVQQCLPPNTFDPRINYYPINAVSYPPNWTVKYYNSYKIINNTASGEVYVIYKCGSPVPSPSSSGQSANATFVPLDPAVPTNAKFFAGPQAAAHVGLTETDTATYFELIGARNTVGFYTPIGSSLPCFNQEITSGMIAPYTDDTVLNPNCTLILLGYGINTTFTKFATATATADTTPLARAAHLEYLGMFVDREYAAAQIYANLTARYNSMSAAANAAANSLSYRPTVAWVSAAPLYDYYSISLSSYKLAYTLAAGGNNINASVTAFFNAASFKSALTSVDILIDESYFYSPPNYTLTLSNLGFFSNETSLYKFLNTSNVWREDGRETISEGDDWFESGVVEADAVLADLIRAIQPSVTTFLQTSAFRNAMNVEYLWFRNVARNETSNVPSTVCPNVNTATVPLALTGLTMPTITCPAFLLNPALYNTTTTGNSSSGSSSSSSGTSRSSSSSATNSSSSSSVTSRSSSSSGTNSSSSSSGTNSSSSSSSRSAISALLLVGCAILSLLL